MQKEKILYISSKDDLLEKINSYCQKYNVEGKDSLYDIEKEKSNLLILSFHKNSELANYINRKLKLLKIEDSNFSDLNTNLIVKVINPKNEKYKQEKKEKEKSEEKENKSTEKQKKEDKIIVILKMYIIQTLKIIQD